MKGDPIVGKDRVRRIILAVILSDYYFHSLCSQFIDEGVELLQGFGVDSLLLTGLVKRLIVVVRDCHEIGLKGEGTDHKHTITQEIRCCCLRLRYILHTFYIFSIKLLRISNGKHYLNY